MNLPVESIKGGGEIQKDSNKIAHTDDTDIKLGITMSYTKLTGYRQYYKP